jgi:hypothetical protein
MNRWSLGISDPLKKTQNKPHSSFQAFYHSQFQFCFFMDTNFVEPSILKMFEVHKIIGKGAYGVVFSRPREKISNFLGEEKC